MSKYKNNVFPYSLYSTANLPAWRPKPTNVTLISFFHPFTGKINPEIKSLFQNYITNAVKIDKICGELSTSHFLM